ncbi:MAG: hypothetical protein U5L95_03280 [Candidatus Saccharibacteria bacterium]|nr:hypothetical protein [Candidatus Saccharibacteria bacterium]
MAEEGVNVKNAECDALIPGCVDAPPFYFGIGLVTGLPLLVVAAAAVFFARRAKSRLLKKIAIVCLVIGLLLLAWYLYGYVVWVIAP